MYVGGVVHHSGNVEVAFWHAFYHKVPPQVFQAVVVPCYVRLAFLQLLPDLCSWSFVAEVSEGLQGPRISENIGHDMSLVKQALNLVPLVPFFGSFQRHPPQSVLVAFLFTVEYGLQIGQTILFGSWWPRVKIYAPLGC
jgi:hypothetical protein